MLDLDLHLHLDLDLDLDLASAFPYQIESRNALAQCQIEIQVLESVLYISVNHNLLEVVMDLDQELDDRHISIKQQMILSPSFEDAKSH
jgi:hypothetical protein